MICDEYSKEKEGTMTVISNGSIKKKNIYATYDTVYLFCKKQEKKN